MNDSLIDGWFLSVARLHDPASTRGDANISVSLLIEHPQLDGAIRTSLGQLVPMMEAFAKVAKEPRNKLLAHNDLRSIMLVGDMGAFVAGEDAQYIKNLSSFAQIVSESVCGEPFIYDRLLMNDVDAVVSTLARGLETL